MTPLEILRAARAKIATPETWCRGAYAQRADGKSVFPTHPDACRWCASGAVRCVAGDYAEIGGVLVALGYCDYVVEVNDTDGHAAVLALFDAAIARLEAAGG